MFVTIAIFILYEHTVGNYDEMKMFSPVRDEVKKENDTGNQDRGVRLKARINVTGHQDMDVYLRMTSANRELVNFYDNVLVRSMSYFWPDIESMVVVLDEEQSEDKLFGNNSQKVFPFPRVCFMENVQIRGYTGCDRMQRDMFYPELCTSKTFVAYVDTDTMFASRVVPEMLFVDSKPKVIGVYGNIADQWYERVSQATVDLFKTKEVMRCMSYFPVIMKVEHIIELRKYLEKIHGLTFDELLMKKTIQIKHISQFNIMCQYIWMFHRDEYVFYLQYQPNTKPGLSSANREDKAYFSKLDISQFQTYPLARVSFHYKYMLEDWTSQIMYRHLFKTSVCFMGGFELCPRVCERYSKDSLRKEMFVFDMLDWTWDSRCMEAQRSHYKELEKYDSAAYREIIKKACCEVDLLVWKLV